MHDGVELPLAGEGLGVVLCLQRLQVVDGVDAAEAEVATEEAGAVAGGLSQRDHGLPPRRMSTSRLSVASWCSVRPSGVVSGE
ncbi:MAG: hypothetical protein ACI8S6_002557 [Myxococcota bacterium]